MTLIASVALVSGLAVQSASAAKPIPQVSFVDYAQCVDGTTDDAATNCPGGWINGILQASNSTYHEDEVTPQRAEILVPAGAPLGNHSVTFTYQARKGSAGVHAYDSLATWNYTQSTAERCLGLTGTDCVGGSPTTAQIPADSTVIAPFTPAGTGATSLHELPDASRLMTAYGLGASGTLSVTTPVHDCTAASACSNPSVDDYASITVNYSVTAVPAKVQFLFGGHLAASAGVRGWGAGFGASNISGGPYHIKWTAADGASIGNRDNQIMGSAILNNPTSILTSVSPTTPIIGDTLQDSATITPSTATGTVTFSLFRPADATCSGTAAYTETVSVSSGSAATVTGFVADTIGTWHWTASYSGDLGSGGTDQPSSSTCASEPTTVGKATPVLTTTASGPVTVGATITDTAHLSGGYGTLTGSISFQVFAPSDTTCSTPLTPQPTGATVSQTAPGSVDYTSGTFTTTEVGTYHWEATFTDTDGNNNSVGPTTCGESGESSVVNPASPSFTTTMKVRPQDSATLSGIVAGGSATGTKTQKITFKLFNNATCDPGIGDVNVIDSESFDATADGTFNTANTHDVSADGTYSWLVSYTGDSNNNAYNPACTTEQFALDFTPLAP
jgi:hypothetical protein